MGGYSVSRMMMWGLLVVTPVLPQVNLRRFPQKFVTRYGAADKQAQHQYSREIRLGGGVRWSAGADHVLRLDPRGKGWQQRQYFGGQRYLAPGEVVGLWHEKSAADETVWIKTTGGATRIELTPMTLAAKAALFEERVRARHDRYGFTADSHLRVPGDLSSNVMVSSDNDGLWTAMYAAGKCFEYAATKSPAALAAARKGVEAVLSLESVTRRAGYPARSWVKAGEPISRDGVWHPAKDGTMVFKSDTSSDEIVGHFYIFGVAYDLWPKEDAVFRDRIRGTAQRMMDHILANGYHLIDFHGGPTWWGRWSPAYFATGRGIPDAPLNALELLSFLKTTHHLTGDEKYAREYRKVAIDMGYLKIAQEYLKRREEINYSDEELAMLPFYLVFRYEKDEEMLAGYRNALEQWWENCKREKNPLWTFIYLTANPKATAYLPGAVDTLYRIPVDLVKWTVKNSHRTDIEKVVEVDRFLATQSKERLAPDELPVMKWNGNPFRLDGGSGGMGEDDGGFFILSYWMGRYGGWLKGE